jgi:hypothetical protein
VSQLDRYSKCACKRCGGHIEFPTEGAGRTIPCPHCHQPTTLVASAPPAAVIVGGGSVARRRIFRLFFIASIAAIAGGAGVYFCFFKGPRLAQPPSATNPPKASATPTPPAPVPAPVAPKVPVDPWHGLVAGQITVEKTGESHLVYAVGKLHNTSDHQRFGVKVELDVFDAENKKVGTATDYTPSIDPGKEWKFRALVVERSAISARLTAVKEN